MHTNNKPQIRADNLQALIRDRYDGNRSKFSRALIAGGVKMSPVQVGQWIDGVRNMSESSAAKIEAALSLPENYFSMGEMPAQAPAQWDANVVPATGLHPVPLISWVRAGAFSEIEEFASDNFVYVDVDTSPYAFALEVVGDSMTTSNNRGVSFPAGMVIVVDPDKAAAAGDYVIIKDVHKQAATFKQYMTDGISHKGLPLNRDYDAIDLDDERYRIIGVVVEAVHRMRF